MYQYYITLKDNNKHLHYTTVEGYRMPGNLGLHKSSSGQYVLTDIMTGAVVDKSCITITQAIEKAQNIDFIKSLQARRKEPNAVRLAEKLKAYVETLKKSDRCNGWRRYFK